MAGEDAEKVQLIAGLAERCPIRQEKEGDECPRARQTPKSLGRAQGRPGQAAKRQRMEQSGQQETGTEVRQRGHLIFMDWDMGISVPVFPDEIGLEGEPAVPWH